MFTLVSFGVTNRCVLKCPHCYRDASRPLPDELSTDECIRLIDELHKSNTRILVFSGGEPLTRQDILELIRYASSLKISTALATSGLPLNEQVINKLADSGLKYIAISLDSSKPEIHDRFRGIPGLWNHVVGLLKIIREYNIDIQINFTLCRLNLDDVKEIIDLCLKYDVKNLHIFHIVPVGRAIKYYEDIKLDMKTVLRVCLEAIKYGIDKVNVKPTCIPQFWPYLKLTDPDLFKKISRGRSIGCIAGISYMYISPRGDVYPCPYTPYTVGNVRKNTLLDIVRCELFDRLRRRELSEPCRSCTFVNVCSGCRARALAYSGDVLGPDPECVIRIL